MPEADLENILATILIYLAGAHYLLIRRKRNSSRGLFPLLAAISGMRRDASAYVVA